jgi:5-keto-L-gluconate epimerase
MKFSFCSGCYGFMPFEDIIDRTRGFGFDGIELTMNFTVKTDDNAERLSEIKIILQNYRLSCPALHCLYPPGMKLSGLSKAERDNVINHHCRIAQIAAELDSPLIVAGGGAARALPVETAGEIEAGRNHRTEFLALLGEVRDICSTYGITIALEPLNRYETNFINTIGDAAELCEELGGTGVGLIGDTFHMNIEETRFFESIVKRKQHLVHIHATDSNRLEPGKGHIDFSEIIRGLRHIGYSGFLSQELFGIKPGMLFFKNAITVDTMLTDGLIHLKSLL